MFNLVYMPILTVFSSRLVTSIRGKLYISPIKFIVSKFVLFSVLAMKLSSECNQLLNGVCLTQQSKQAKINILRRLYGTLQYSAILTIHSWVCKDLTE